MYSTVCGTYSTPTVLASKKTESLLGRLKGAMQYVECRLASTLTTTTLYNSIEIQSQSVERNIIGNFVGYRVQYWDF